MVIFQFFNFVCHEDRPSEAIHPIIEHKCYLQLLTNMEGREHTANRYETLLAAICAGVCVCVFVCVRVRVCECVKIRNAMKYCHKYS